MKPKLQLLCGMIASGKSTYAKNVAYEGGIIINDDAIVNLLHADIYTLYDKNLKILYKATENHIVSLALALQRLVLIDRGLNVSRSGRQRWVALAKSFDVPCEAVVFPNDEPYVHAKRRFDSDSRGHTLEYWEKVALHHCSKYEEPTEEEGFDKVHYLDFSMISSGKVIL